MVIITDMMLFSAEEHSSMTRLVEVSQLTGGHTQKYFHVPGAHTKSACGHHTQQAYHIGISV